MKDIYKSFNSEDEMDDFFHFFSEDMNVAFGALMEYEWLFMENIKDLEKIQKQQKDMKFYWESWKSGVIPTATSNWGRYNEVAVLFGDNPNMFISYSSKRTFLELFQEWAPSWGVDLEIEDGRKDDEVIISFLYEF